MGICAAAAMLVFILAARAIRSLFGGEADTSAGVEYIKQEEAGDISAIRVAALSAGSNIDLLERQDAGENDERSIKEKFSGAVVIGDSIALGFEEYDVLNASSVAAEIGVHLTQMDELIAKVKDLSPGIIFIAMGSNDVTATNGDTEEFISRYQDVIDQLQKEVPDAHIFVNAVFPVQDKAVEEEPGLANIADYNAALKEMCNSKTIGFIDNTQIVSEEYFEPDGIHFKAAFYPIWAQRMAEVASL